MARPDRLFRLLHLLRLLPAPVTAERLAEETGVSLRTLYRDVDSLRAAGARIDGERGYGYRLLEDRALPPQAFDRLEIEALVLGLAEVRHMGDPGLAEAAASVLAKVAATLPDEAERQLFHAVTHVYHPGHSALAAVDLQVLREACWREEALWLRYADKAGALTERTVWPLALVHTDGALCLPAWCCLREGFRLFRCERIVEVRLTGQSFRPRRAALLRNYTALIAGSERRGASNQG